MAHAFVYGDGHYTYDDGDGQYDDGHSDLCDGDGHYTYVDGDGHYDDGGGRFDNGHSVLLHHLSPQHAQCAQPTATRQGQAPREDHGGEGHCDAGDGHCDDGDVGFDDGH